MNKQKIKEFAKKYETEIKLWGSVAMVIGGSGLIGYSIGCQRNKSLPNEICVNNEVVKRVFSDIPNGTKVNLFGAIKKTGVTKDELGELGKIMEKLGVPEDDKFTHFIAIGKCDET